MEWVKLAASPAFYMDGALLRAGEAAEVLFCRALAHCGAVESEGRVDKTVLPLLIQVRAQARADALVREGLWVDAGTHYLVRSWEKWQDEHDAAAKKRRADRERLRQKRQVSRDTVARQSRDTLRQDGDSRALEGEGERERETQPTTSVGTADKPRRATRIPDVFPFSTEHADQLAAWAAEHTPAVAIRIETANWRDWHLAKGDTAKDWVASWRTWMRRAQKDAERGRPGTSLAATGPRPSTTDAKVAQTLQLAARFREQDAS